MAPVVLPGAPSLPAGPDGPAFAATPVPVSAIALPPPGSLSLGVSSAFRSPAAVGVNRTPIRQERPGRVGGQASRTSMATTSFIRTAETSEQG
jgi:hypothetical protein